VKKSVTLTLVLAGLATSAQAAHAEPVLTKAELASATQQAEAAGTIESIEASGGSQEAVEAAFDPEQQELASLAPSEKRSATLDLVVMHGHFEDLNAKAPRGDPAPTGTVMSFVLNRGTGRVAAVGVGDTAPTFPLGTTVERPTITTSLRAQSASSRRPRRARARAATWGNDCKPEPSYDHCWVVDTWEMKGAEQVYGVYDEADTAYIEVPGWEKGYFVDNEVWSSAHSKADTWTEIGQQAGEGKGCCNTWWFYAYQIENSKNYKAFVDEPYVWEVPEGVGNHYAMETPGEGIWCWYYGSFELKACKSGFAHNATQLEAGGEVATEAKPSFAASTNNSALWTNGEGWKTWIRGNVVTTTTGFCTSPLNGAPGNIYYDTCG
jgi:hypothetical protein